MTGCVSRIALVNGHLIDPKNGIDALHDIVIEGGVVRDVGRNIDRSQFDRAGSTTVIDIEGCVVTPALIDIHTHLFCTAGNPNAWAGENSVWPDAFSFRNGICTMVDTGSSGWRNFPLFRTTVIDRVRTRAFALLNIASYGMINEMGEQYPSDFDPETTARVARENSDCVVGCKTAHYQGPDWKSVDSAVAAADLAGIFAMIDFGYFRKERPYWELVLKHMRSGDISTHCFRGPVPVVDSNGTVYPYLRRARERGVLFDVGHGEGSFLFRNAAPAIEQGFYPDTISSDLHTLCMNSSMMDLPTVISKFLALGMPLSAAISCVTWNAAQAIGRRELGHLSPSAVADVAVWSEQRGVFGYGDTVGGKVIGDRRLCCEMTIKGGAIEWDRNARAAVDWRSVDRQAGVRIGREWLLEPSGEALDD